MPILDIEVVVAEEEPIDSGWAHRIADASGRTFGTQPGQTWVRVRRLQHSDYAENEAKISPELRPVFVSVLKAQVTPIDVLRVEVRQLTQDIAQVTGRCEENAHILYLPSAAGRMSFGGALVE